MLKEFIERSPKSRAEWAKELRISEPFLSQLANGKKRPSLELAFQIERATGGAVPASSWVIDGGEGSPGLSDTRSPPPAVQV